MAIKVESSRASVSYTGFFAAGSAELQADMRDLLGPIMDELQREADQIRVDEIAAKWPVKSGKSLRGWHTFQEADSDKLAVAVVLDNDFAYARYIKSTKISTRDDATRLRSPMSQHVRKPGTQARRRLRKVLPLMLATLVERIANGG
jgi:hypothetical protein